MCLFDSDRQQQRQQPPLSGILGGAGGFANGLFSQMQQAVPALPPISWRRYDIPQDEPLQLISFYDRLRNEIDEWLKL